MKLLLLSICIFLVSYSPEQLPEGWKKIEKTKIAGETFEIYFFDYMTRIESIEPNISSLKGREFTNALANIQFRYPTYIAKKEVRKQDSLIYYVLRPNPEKSKQMFSFDLVVVKVQKDYLLSSFEDKEFYKAFIIKKVDAIGCRNSLMTEHNKFVQDNPNKKDIIGNGIQIADSIYTRVIPYDEIKKPFLRLLEAN